MEATILQRKKKIIDLKGDTFRSLSVMAASKGLNLKNFIEGLLDKVAEEYDDNKANETEKEDFENWLGV